METIKRFEDYQKLALVTASSGKGRTIEGLVRVCGLVGEAAELRDELCIWLAGGSVEEVKKELGDVLWYAATLSEWLGLAMRFEFASLQIQAGRCHYEDGFKLVTLARAGKLAELMKKHLGHDKPIEAFNGRELALMQDVLVAIAHVANTVGINLAEVAALNIAKLRARHHGGGFTTAAQNAKADEKPEGWTSGPV